MKNPILDEALDISSVSMLDAALEHAHRGWSVLPLYSIDSKGQCTCGRIDCPSAGKHPITELVPHGASDATADPKQIERMWSGPWAGANIGGHLGKTGLIAVDTDPRNGGAKTLLEIESQIPTIHDTLRTETGGGGTHNIFQDDSSLVKNIGTLGLGIDIKRGNSYIVLPPSHHRSGKQYKWKNSLEPAPMPAGLKTRLTPAPIKRSEPGYTGTAYSFDKLYSKLPRYIKPPRNVKDYKIYCPFHDDGENPSFSINRETGQWYCFGSCQRGGGPDEIRQFVDAGFSQLLAYLNERIAILESPAGAFLHTITDENGRPSAEIVTRANLTNLYADIPPPQGFPNSIAWLVREPGRKKYKKIVFAPNESPSGCYNLWQGWTISAEKGDCSLYWEHLLNIICGRDEQKFTYLKKYMAHAVQLPNVLPEVALILLGREGVGKGIFAQFFGRLFGNHFAHVHRTDDVTGRFNEHLANAVVVLADEATWGGNKQHQGVLKAGITEKRIRVEQKNQPSYEITNCRRTIFASNEQWPVAIGESDRRFVLFEVSDSKAGNSEYFHRIGTQMDTGGLRALMYDLTVEDLQGWDPRQRPLSASTWSIKLKSLDTEEQFWYEVLLAGYARRKAVPQDDGENRMLDWPKSDEGLLSKSDLYGCYEEFCKPQRSRLVNNSVFFRNAYTRGFLKRECPRDDNRRMRIYAPGLSIARRFYEIAVKEGKEIWRDGALEGPSPKVQPEKDSDLLNPSHQLGSPG